MSHTYHKIWLHIIWGTKNREKFITQKLNNEFIQHIDEYSKEKGFKIEITNCHLDHVHCLIEIHPKFSVSEIVNLIKGESSHWINSNKLTKTHFAWATGYAVFSVSESNVDRVKSYIENQAKHHKVTSYTEEVEKILAAYKITP